MEQIDVTAKQPIIKPVIVFIIALIALKFLVFNDDSTESQAGSKPVALNIEQSHKAAKRLCTHYLMDSADGFKIKKTTIQESQSGFGYRVVANGTQYGAPAIRYCETDSTFTVVTSSNRG